MILNRQSDSLSRFLTVLPKLPYHLLNAGFYQEQQLCPTAGNHTSVLLQKVTFMTPLTTVFSLFLDSGAHTNHIESRWNALKRSLP